jgi:hypothetical protein
MPPDLPQPTNPDTDLSRDELERHFRAAEMERAARKLGLTTTDVMLENVRLAVRTLKQLTAEVDDRADLTKPCRMMPGHPRLW